MYAETNGKSTLNILSIKSFKSVQTINYKTILLLFKFNNFTLSSTPKILIFFENYFRKYNL